MLMYWKPCVHNLLLVFSQRRDDLLDNICSDLYASPDMGTSASDPGGKTDVKPSALKDDYEIGEEFYWLV